MTAVSQMGRDNAVDGLKGLAILAVLLLHALPRHVLDDSLAVFHIWQAVPVFIVLMGYTGVLTRVAPLRLYAHRRFKRLLVPFAVILLVSTAIAATRGQLAWNPLLLVGLLPATGPGNYFITLAMAFALALPLLRRLLDTNPQTFALAALALSIGSELSFWVFPYSGYLHSASLFRVLFGAALGMLIASGHKATRWLPWLLLISVPFLTAVALGHYLPFMADAWQSQSFVAAAYPATLVLLGLRLRYPSLIASLGRTSYHIFLVQILWFEYAAPQVTGLPVHSGVQILVNVLVCVVAGVVFARADGLVLRGFADRVPLLPNKRIEQNAER